MLRIFILDDVRNIPAAISNASAALWKEYLDSADKRVVVMARPFRHNGEELIADFQNAIDTLEENPTFDYWILDNDLGPGLEGYDFLKQMISQMPSRMPEVVLSCSANRERRNQIEAYFDNWHRAGRPRI